MQYIHAGGDKMLAILLKDITIDEGLVLKKNETVFINPENSYATVIKQGERICFDIHKDEYATFN
jgi:hypothetical protein